MRKALAAVVAVVLLHVGGESGAQDTVGDLKAKGAVVLSAEEAKTLLSGATVSYEAGNFETQIKLETDGVVVGSARQRIGGAGGTSLTGTWKVTDKGLWCTSTRAAVGGGAEWCRSVLKLGESYYYAVYVSKPEGPAYPLKIRK